jgi:hypothetical protein
MASVRDLVVTPRLFVRWNNPPKSVGKRDAGHQQPDRSHGRRRAPSRLIRFLRTEPVSGPDPRRDAIAVSPGPSPSLRPPCSPISGGWPQRRQPCGKLIRHGDASRIRTFPVPPIWQFVQLRSRLSLGTRGHLCHVRITTRHAGTSGERPHTALSDVGDPTERHASLRLRAWRKNQRCSVPRPDSR